MPSRVPRFVHTCLPSNTSTIPPTAASAPVITNSATGTADVIAVCGGGTMPAVNHANKSYAPVIPMSAPARSIVRESGVAVNLPTSTRRSSPMRAIAAITATASSATVITTIFTVKWPVFGSRDSGAVTTRIAVTTTVIAHPIHHIPLTP